MSLLFSDAQYAVTGDCRPIFLTSCTDSSATCTQALAFSLRRTFSVLAVDFFLAELSKGKGIEGHLLFDVCPHFCIVLNHGCMRDVAIQVLITRFQP